MQHSCSHDNAVRSINSQTCTYLRTEQDQNSVTTSLPHHFPSSPPCVIATTSHVPTSLPHHSPSSPLSFVTTSLTTSHRHESPPPIVPTSLPHHSPSSPLPSVTTSLHHHFPSSPLPIVTTSLQHHFPSSPPCLIASYSFVMYCYCIVM